MFAVIAMIDEDSMDYKIFGDGDKARECYAELSAWVGRGGLYSISVYEVIGAQDAREASRMIAKPEAGELVLLSIKKAGSQWVADFDRHKFKKMVLEYWSEHNA